MMGRLRVGLCLVGVSLSAINYCDIDIFATWSPTAIPSAWKQKSPKRDTMLYRNLYRIENRIYLSVIYQFDMSCILSPSPAPVFFVNFLCYQIFRQLNLSGASHPVCLKLWFSHTCVCVSIMALVIALRLRTVLYIYRPGEILWLKWIIIQK